LCVCACFTPAITPPFAARCRHQAEFGARAKTAPCGSLWNFRPVTVLAFAKFLMRCRARLLSPQSVNEQQTQGDDSVSKKSYEHKHQIKEAKQQHRRMSAIVGFKNPRFARTAPT